MLPTRGKRTGEVEAKVHAAMQRLTPEQTRMVLALMVLLPWGLLLSCVGTAHVLVVR